MEKTTIEMENELLLTGYGYTSLMSLKPNTNFDKKTENKSK